MKNYSASKELKMLGHDYDLVSQQLKSLAFHLPYCARYRMKEFQNFLLCQTVRKQLILYLISSPQNFEPAHEILVLTCIAHETSYGSLESAHLQSLVQAFPVEDCSYTQSMEVDCHAC